jgi:energy-coupling factor transport system substrate-specific component
MRELIRCWQHTRMIVLIALCAALYVAVLLPFKIATIVPGITEIRPGAALPFFFSIFFGPAAAWGSAFGNTIGDVLGGTIGPGTIAGFVGNFLYGFVPYRVLRAYPNSREELSSRRGSIVFVFAVILAAAVCALPISLGVDLIGYAFDLVVHTIFLNNVLVSLVLAPLLIRALGKRIRAMKLTYEQVLPPEQISGTLKVGPIIVLILILCIYAFMMIPSLHAAIPVGKNVFQIASALLLVAATLLLI